MPKIDYYLDESDPDIVVLRRQDGSFVAAFSAQGATRREGIVDAAKEDYQKVIEAKVESLDPRGEGDRQKSAQSGSKVYVIDADGSDGTGLTCNVELVSWGIGQER